MTGLDKRFKKVVIWGYPLHSHTHSYIHAAYYKAFKYLGYDTYWFTDNDHPGNFDYTDTLFFASTGNENSPETSHENKIPLIKDSYYILHNVNCKRYIEAGCKILQLQVHNIDNYKHSPIDIINSYTVLQKGSVNCLCQPWATDLLPGEINLDDARNEREHRVCVWIGTFGGGDHPFECHSNLDPFFEACRNHAIEVKIIDPWTNPINFDENKSLVNGSFFAPSINARWQNEQQYIPCRIFKNISYGHMGITNNPKVNEIFDSAVVFDVTPITLFGLAMQEKKRPDAIDRIKYLMNEVKEKHTYMRRVEMLLKYLPD
jgi:hypothetical protein